MSGAVAGVAVVAVAAGRKVSLILEAFCWGVEIKGEMRGEMGWNEVGGRIEVGEGVGG